MAFPPPLDSQPQPHPYLREPVLYISNLAPTVTDADLARALGDCVPFRPKIARDGSDRPLSGTIEFKHIEKGETSCLWMHCAPFSEDVERNQAAYP